MNDFTIEELEQLREHDNMSNELHRKIQSMIDKYCEHEYSESLVKISNMWTRACNICGEPK